MKNNGQLKSTERGTVFSKNKPSDRLSTPK